MLHICCAIFGALLFIISNAQTSISLPVVFYSYGELDASTQDAKLALLVQCSNSTGGLPLIQLTIIQPENPGFVNTRAYAVVEISSNPNSFEELYIVGTNYIKNGGQMHAFNNITFYYNGSVTNLAIRYKSEIGGTPISLHLTYVSNNSDNPIFVGRYDSTVFNTNSVPSLITYFGQQVKLDAVGSVSNEQYIYYFFSFCEKDIFISSQNYYTVTIQISSDLSTKLAAFDLVGCSARDVPDYENDCTVVNTGLTSIVIDNDPASIVSVTMDSRNQYLSDGIFVGVYGYGGELSNNNAYLLNVQEQPYSN